MTKKPINMINKNLKNDDTFDIKESYAEPTDSLNVATCIRDIEAKKYAKRYERSIKKLDVAGIMDSIDHEKFTELLKNGPEDEDIILGPIFGGTCDIVLKIDRGFNAVVVISFDSYGRSIRINTYLGMNYIPKTRITENFGKKWDEIAISRGYY